MEFRLGKKPHVDDRRTLKLAKFMLPTVRVPAVYDFDKIRKPFKIHMWGNDNWGDCVFAARANSQVRLERIEQRRTIPLTDNDVVEIYKRLTGSQSPGDANDEGYVILEAMKQWRKEGWKIGSRNYTIDAFGEVNHQSITELQAACYMLTGVTFGFALPRAAAGKNAWLYNGETGPDWEPGSWGGHCVYSARYDQGNFYVLSWGRVMQVNNAFIQKFADEAWAVVDSADSWRVKETIDVPQLLAELRQVATVQP